MKKEQEVSSRSPYLDNIKGILIFLVVFTHCLYASQGDTIINYIVDFVYMFHMPAFVFVTGYLSKSENSRSPLSLLRLGICYVIFNAVMLYCFYPHSMRALTPYNSMWYILAVIVWRAAAPKLAKIRRIVPVLTLAALAAGCWSDIDNILAIARIICFSPFFMAGYLFDKERLGRLATKKTARTYLTGAVCLITAAAVGGFALLKLDFTDNELTWNSYNSLNDVMERVIILIVAVLALTSILCLVSDKKLPFINQIGRNSLSVYLCHRPLTLIFSYYFGASQETGKLIALSFAATLLISLLFGGNLFSSLLNRCIDYIRDIITGVNKKKSLRVLTVIVAVVIAISPLLSDAERFTFRPYTEESGQSEDAPSESGTDVMHRIMSAEEKARFDNAFRIVFSGDIILLEDQVKRGYKNGKYDFSELFEYTEKYISSADLAIGVFEGPMGGAMAGYSTSNYGDGKKLYLNFPDELASAVKNAGFDLVTTANNHLLDKGEAAAHRTLDILDSVGLDHTGSYRSVAEKNKENVKLIEKDGIKFAVLSYTYGSNYYSENELLNGGISYITSVLTEPESESFEQVKEQVRADFEKAKALSPDLIIVLPHMGTQFLDYPDEYQKTWCDIFRSFGADIILSDHTHSVQPAEIETAEGKNLFTAYCPGNYANIYREHNGDASALIEVYIDRATKKVIGGGIIPMWTCSTIDGNYRPLPVYDILNDDTLRNSLTTDDLTRAETVFGHITSVMLGTKLDADLAGERCYFDSEGFLRLPSPPLALTEEMKSGGFYKALTSAESVCFIGDSVTEGTKNGGCPWYEPLTEYCRSIRSCSKGGGTVSTMIDMLPRINSENSSLYVIAIGTNDVRYRNEETCAMTPSEYVLRIDELVRGINNSSSADFVFIAPWTSTDGDPYCNMSYSEKKSLNEEYSSALESYCREKGYMFINPNGYIEERLSTEPSSEYLLDHIHPNFTKGIRLYSEAALLCSPKAEN